VTREQAPVPAATRHAAVLVAALLVGACGDDSVTPPPTGTEVAELVRVSGDQQQWFFENPLPQPYLVMAVDSDGLAVPDVAISWTITSGGGTVDPMQSLTDAAGTASTTHTLGPVETSQAVTAAVPGIPSVTFTATASTPPTSAAVTVGNNFFSHRDVLVQVGGSVTWTWDSGPIVHNVTFTAGPSPRPSDSPTQDSGTHTDQLPVVARYEYACTIHAGMEGTVTVVH